MVRVKINYITAMGTNKQENLSFPDGILPDMLAVLA